MTEMDAEMAFLAAQKEEEEYNPAGDYSYDYDPEQPAPEGGDDEEEEEYEPEPQETHSPSVQSASMPPESAADAPTAATEGPLKPVPAEAPAAPMPSKQPRTKGGFVDESEDDEDEVPVTAAKAGTALLNAPGVSESPKRSATLSPSNAQANQQHNLPSISVQNEGVPGVLPAAVAVPESVSQAASVPNGSSAPDDQPTKPAHLNAAPARHFTTPATPVSASLPKSRLPQDKVGMFEDRIAEDPRGDIEAWLGLIDEHRKRHKYVEARATYDDFFKVFPTAGEQWVEYVNMETELDDFTAVEKIFGRSIQITPYIALWSSYINYIRRRNNLTTDQTGTARTVIVQVYEFVLDNVGIDPDAGKIWIDYIDVLKSGPGVLGGSNWQDMQKMDTLRKVYQRAIAVPTNATMEIWKDYDKFEMNLNKATGRKHLQEKSALYMTARSAITVLQGTILRNIHRTTLPKLPPAAGFDGADDYAKQVQAWKNWVEYEKGDPLEIKEDDLALYNKRILYLYKNTLMALRFWPEMWYEAAEWCYRSDMKDEGDKFLEEGMKANPESCLLAFRMAAQIETRTDFEDGEAGIIAKGKAVRAPFNTVLDALYDLTNKAKKREEQTIARAKDVFAAQQAAEDAARGTSDKGSDDDDEEEAREAARRQQQRQAALDAQLKGISNAANAEIHTLKRTLSYAWIALMRAMRRVQGKGAPNAAVGGFRGIFGEARKRGKLLSDAYVASALIEHHCYQDGAATKIFDRGMKLFPDDENFALEYVKHLVKLNDATNARAVFETVVTRLTQKPENIQRAKPLFVFFHDYESQFGELAQITKLEQRMATLFPEDPLLLRFSARFSNSTFDPTSIRPVISPRTQMRPVMPSGMQGGMPGGIPGGMPGGMPGGNVMPTIEDNFPKAPQMQPQQDLRMASPAPGPGPGALNSPRMAHLMPATNSPKRPLEDADTTEQPRKFARGESPLKGAAGRRLDAARRSNMAVSGGSAAQAPLAWPREINFLLGIIPNASTYNATRFSPERMVELLQNIKLPLPPQPLGGGFAAAAPVSGPPAAHINTQLQSLQQRYGGAGGSGWA